MFNLHWADKAIVLVYFIILWVVGVSKKSKDEEGYILAGRTLTMPAFVATLVATWYGGVLGVGEFYHRFGLSTWLLQGLPYYLFAVLFAFFLVDKVRQDEILTIPDRLYKHYGRSTSMIGSILIFLHSIPATKVLMLGVIFQLVFGCPLPLAVILGTFFSMIYVFFGGFRSVVKTDKIQLILMVISCLIIMPAALKAVGGFSSLAAALPAKHPSLTGGHRLSYILVWFSFALWTLIAPSFHQRCYAARTSQTAKKGIMISLVFWVVLDALLATTGLCSRVLLPTIDPVQAYPVLADKLLPPIIKGIFFAGVFSFIMAALDSHYHIGSVTLAYDIMGRKNKEKGFPFKLGLLVTAGLAIILALFFPSVVKLWYLIYTVTVPALLLPVLLSYFPAWRLEGFQTLVMMVSGGGIAILWLILSREGNYPANVEPFFAGLIASGTWYLIGKIMQRKDDEPAISKLQ
ncbi:MAG: sodium:solute symporter family protein [Chlamydiota bacterium]